MNQLRRITVFETRFHKGDLSRNKQSDGFVRPESTAPARLDSAVRPEPPARPLGPLGPEVFLDAFDYDEDGFLDPRDFNLDRENQQCDGENESEGTWWG